MRFVLLVTRWFRQLASSRYKRVFVATFLVILALGVIGPMHSFAQVPSPAPVAEVSAPAAPTAIAAPPASAEQPTPPNFFVAQILLVITTILQYLTAALAFLVLTVIEMIIVPILQYNSFSISPTIDLGWSLVRDVVNMFVILVLLVMAMATIVGYEKASWQKNLPQFLLAVILVNFSRTICGVLIDISQVVMFTFVNAILDVGAGNFAALFDLNLFGDYSQTGTVDIETRAAQSIDAGAQLGAAYLSFILYACILAVMLLMAFVYIWRIILLWILVILSPLTFFTWGMGGMFKFTSGSSSDWWKKFTSALIIGPMLTFFLWLALSTATGDIVATEQFKLADTGVPSTLAAFETSNLLATFLALCLLIVGMQQSAAAASSMGGFAKKAMGDDKMGEKLVGGAVKLTNRASGLSALTYGASRVGVEGGRLASGLVMKAGAAASSIPIVGGVVGRSLVNAGGAVQQQAEGYQKTAQKAAKERLDKYTDEQKAAHFSLIASGRKGSINVNTLDDINALQSDLALNKGLRKKTKEAFGENKEGNERALDSAMVQAEKNKDSFDDGQKDKFNTFKSERLHRLTGVIDPKDKVATKKYTEALNKHVQDEKFKGRDLSEDAVKSKDVHAALKERVIRMGKGGKKITAYAELMNGMYGKALMDAAKGAGAVVPEYPEEDDDDFDGGNSGTPTPTAPTTQPARPRRPQRPRRGGGGGAGGGSQSGGAAPTGGGPAGAPPATGGGVANTAAPSNSRNQFYAARSGNAIDVDTTPSTASYTPLTRPMTAPEIFAAKRARENAGPRPADIYASAETFPIRPGNTPPPTAEA